MVKSLRDDLTEDQLSAILSATRPLPLADHDAFLDDVADALDGVELGDGVVSDHQGRAAPLPQTA